MPVVPKEVDGDGKGGVFLVFLKTSFLPSTSGSSMSARRITTRLYEDIAMWRHTPYSLNPNLKKELEIKKMFFID